MLFDDKFFMFSIFHDLEITLHASRREGRRSDLSVKSARACSDRKRRFVGRCRISTIKKPGSELQIVSSPLVEVKPLLSVTWTWVFILFYFFIVFNEHEEIRIAPEKVRDYVCSCTKRIVLRQRTPGNFTSSTGPVSRTFP